MKTAVEVLLFIALTAAFAFYIYALQEHIWQDRAYWDYITCGIVVGDTTQWNDDNFWINTTAEVECGAFMAWFIFMLLKCNSNSSGPTTGRTD